MPDVGRHFRIAGLPTIILLDASGRELYRHLGMISPEDLRDRIETARAGDRNVAEE